MSELALGLIETRGLIAAIEAADAALKAADVRLISKDRVDGALITIKLTGDVAAVQAAVDAGAAAAQRVGVLVSAHVIARPDKGIHDTLAFVRIDSKKKKPLAAPAEHDGSNLSQAPSSDLAPSSETLKQYTVEDLRRMARKVEGLPIQGREISRANKEELIQLICQYTA
ncbi:microcompartments protein [Chloroherpeton thalassium ATCC 35110]|uniref:Microcompartments protein n=1 Tax=Chloroherpeton thalassium (strain ATCC 35110 / GB-78) TaxID=517418 RepID=B3QU84_CHLT3|nr:BMC domain-containing protein [Chloroherpeton thalassium]ACF14333.1 microcompartments protein [Chloroherpeton thalassium ATCC 35110]